MSWSERYDNTVESVYKQHQGTVQKCCLFSRLLLTEPALNRSIIDFLGFAAHVEEVELKPLLPTVQPAAEIGEAVQDSKVLSLFIMIGPFSLKHVC